MLTGKELLVSLIEKAIASNQSSDEQKKNLKFDSTEYKTFLASFESPDDITKLPDKILEKVIENISPSESAQSFAAGIKFIKGLAELNKDKNLSLVLDEEQLKLIEELKNLIKDIINKNELLIEKVEKGEGDSKYQEVLDLIKSDEIIKAADYELIEDIIRRTVDNGMDVSLDSAMTYLNNRNAEILKAMFGWTKERPKEEAKTKEISEIRAKLMKEEAAPRKTELRELNPTNEPLPVEAKLESPKLKTKMLNITTEPVINPTIETNQEVEEIRKKLMREEPTLEPLKIEVSEAKKINVKESQTTKLPKNITLVEKEQKIKEVFSSLEQNYDSFDIAIKNKLLSIKDLAEFEQLAKFLKERDPIILNNLDNDNLRGLIYLFTESNQTVIEKVLHNLTYLHQISDSDLSEIINCATSIFGIKNHANFLIVSKIIRDYKISITEVIKNSILFLISDGRKLEKIIKSLEERGASIKTLVEKCTSTLTNNINLINRNVSTLEMYGYDLKYFFNYKDCYYLLNTHNLSVKLDQFIETGLNEYIHNTGGHPGKNARNLITRRINYAYKNEIPAWDIKMEENHLKPTEEFLAKQKEDGEPIFAKDVKESYISYIDNSEYFITESDISLLIAEHPILEVIDEGYRPAIYSDTPLALLKRKTELLFDKKIISRLKTYRTFKLLVAQGIDDKNALVFALIYKTALEDNEYNYIKNAVEVAKECCNNA